MEALTARQALERAAADYLKARVASSDWFMESLRALYLKILPQLMGSVRRITLLSLVALLFRVLLFIGASALPFLIKKAYTGTLDTGNEGDPYILVDRILQSWDHIDSWLLFLGVCFNGMPRFLEKAAQRLKAKKAPSHQHCHHLATAIHSAPFSLPQTQKYASAVQGAIEHALSGLLVEMCDMVSTLGQHSPITEITLLEFCNKDGSQIRVRARSNLAEREQNQRSVESWRFFAYYIAKRGRPFSENNFLNTKNPFKKTRLTVLGEVKVTYRSVLYLPIIKSERDNQGTAVDKCLGVICVHSPQPYKFWQWGDQLEAGSGFADIAFNRALPYISLVRRLMEPTAHSLIVENRT